MILGSFAINTDHAVSHKLDRQPDGWMLWENSKIHLAWLGFSDIHSGILEYQINIGSAYLASDLNEVRWVAIFCLLKRPMNSFCRHPETKLFDNEKNVDSFDKIPNVI